MRLFFLILFFLFTSTQLKAALVDTVETYSQAMEKTIKAVVIRPTAPKSKQKLPVVYLLHGYSGNYKNWIEKAPKLSMYADLYNIIIVCPDGSNSWYIDSPQDAEFRYEQYIAHELVEWIDKHYNTIQSPEGRAVTGLSMGGHGALYLAFGNQDVFGAAGSMSGGVDLRPFPNNWQLAERLGPYAQYPQRWDKHSVINLVHLLQPKGLSIMIDCGTDDFFYTVNVNLHRKLLERNIPHDFIIRPGGHNWTYWQNAVRYQLLFMANFFNESAALSKSN